MGNKALAVCLYIKKKKTILDKRKHFIEPKRTNLALFTDFKKTFDLIDHSILFLKFFDYGFKNNALILIVW